MTEPREIEWRLVEPGKWRLDGTAVTITLTIGCPMAYRVEWGGKMITAMGTLPEAKRRANKFCAELQEAGFEP